LPPGMFEQVMTLFLGPVGHVISYFLRGGTLLNWVGIAETDDVSEESWTVKLPWQQLKDYYRGWHPVVQAAIDAADKDQCYRWSLFNRPPIPEWSSSRVTLLGDSAHPTLPYLAQGAAMAIEDGAVLTRALAMTDSMPEASELYLGTRLERTPRIVLQSTANRELFHPKSEQEIRARFA